MIDNVIIWIRTSAKNVLTKPKNLVRENQII